MILNDKLVRNIKVNEMWFQLCYNEYDNTFSYNWANDRGVRKGQYHKMNGIRTPYFILEQAERLNKDNNNLNVADFTKLLNKFLYDNFDKQLLDNIKKQELERHNKKNKEYKGIYPYIENVDTGIKHYQRNDNTVKQYLRVFNEHDTLYKGYDKDNNEIKL